MWNEWMKNIAYLPYCPPNGDYFKAGFLASGEVCVKPGVKGTVDCPLPIRHQHFLTTCIHGMLTVVIDLSSHTGPRNVAYKHQVLICPGHHCNVTNNSNVSGSESITIDGGQRFCGSGTWKGTARVAVPAPCLEGHRRTQGLGAHGLFWGSFTHMSVLGSKTHTRPTVMCPLCDLSKWLVSSRHGRPQDSPAHVAIRDSKHRPPSTYLKLTVPLWPCPKCHMVSPLLSTVGRGSHQPAQIPRLEMQTLPLGWRNSMGFEIVF